jgi:2-hydroxychromene-2-carboxylate isomerase
MTDKNAWINRERLLWAKTFNVPMRNSLPPNFPPMTLNIMRCLAALDKAGGPNNQSRLVEALNALYHDFWVDHCEVNDPQVLRLLLERVVGGNVAAEILAAAASNEGKDILVRNTDEAFAAGAFGLPWMICTNSKGETESFWGVDHIGQVADFLGLQRPTKGAWRAVL